METKKAVKTGRTNRKTGKIRIPKAISGFRKRRIRKDVKADTERLIKKQIRKLAAKMRRAPEKTVAVILVLTTLLFSFGSKLFTVVPTWNEVYQALGIAPDSYGALDFDPMPLTLTVLDVGQGECVFVYDEKGVSILYDTGEQGNGEKILAYLKNFGVDELDYLILSHPHSDHTGSVREIIESREIRIANVIIPEIESSDMYSESNDNSESNDTSDFDALENIIKFSGACVSKAKAGDSFSKGDTTLDVLAPTHRRENLNNMSLVVRITYGETAFLLMGDAESEEEYDLLCTCTPATLSADVLVVGHHGSETSSTYDFVSSVKPSYTIISCGADNKYGHPHAVTLNTFESFETEIYRTDLFGNVVIGTDGKKTIALR